MKYTIALPLTILLCAAMIFAGCTGTQNTAGTSAPATASGSGSAQGGWSLTTSPTDSIPEYNMVKVDVGEKDYLGNIAVTFEGGMGQIHVTKIDVVLYRQDGQTITGTVGTNKGDEVTPTLQGTKQTDRVVVYVSFDNGQRLKVYDMLSPYRTRG